MSFLHKSQMGSPKKHEYNTLLFEKILRKYETKPSMQLPSKRTRDQNINKERKVNENNQNNKILIDLNRKIKIVRAIPKDQGGNKENIQDNGATYSFNSGCSENRQYSDILKSFQNRNKEIQHGGYSDVNQFMAEQSYIKINHKIIDDEQNSLQSLNLQSINKVDVSCLLLSNNQPPKNYELTKEQLQVQIQSTLPVIQLVKTHIDILKNENNENNENNDNNEKKDTQNVHHIKTKLSLRILKRKLQKHSLQQVIDDVISHRRIQLDGYCSEPQKQAITEALMSFMKNQVIN